MIQRSTSRWSQFSAAAVHLYTASGAVLAFLMVLAAIQGNAVQALWISDRAHLNRFVSVQPEYNLLKREVEREIVPVCQEFGLGIIPYFPLDAGVLTGKYQPGEPAPEGTRGYDNPRFAPRLRQSTLEAVQRLDAWARESDDTVAELALAWLASRPAVSTIIAGTRRPEQVAANARAADWKLTPDDLAEVEQLLRLVEDPSFMPD